MNEETAKLISELAQKLGTTAEHLWGVLVRQAPISSATDCIETACLLAFSFWIVQFYRTRPKLEWPEKAGMFEDQKLPKGIITRWLLFGAVCFVLSTAFLNLFGDWKLTMAGFFNPEFWAFKQIVK